MSPGPDCLKSVISKFGLRVKVYTTIKSQLEAETKQAVSRAIPITFYVAQAERCRHQGQWVKLILIMIIT